MKRLTTSIFAVAALCLTAACGNGKQPSAAGGDIDTAAVTQSVEQESTTAQADVKKLDNVVKAGNAQEVQICIQDAQKHIQELLEKGETTAAYAYVQKLQEYLTQNKSALETLKIEGSTTAAKAIEAATALPDDIKESAAATYEAVKEKTASSAEAAINEAKEGANSKIEAAKEAGQQKVEDVKAAAQQKVEDTQKAAEQKVEEAKTAARQKASEEIDKGVESLKDKLKNIGH